MGLRVYICGSWYRRDYLKKEMEKIESYGHEVTDWTFEEADWYEPAKLTTIAERDMNKVLEADVVIGHLEYDESKMRGTYTEIGAGIGAGKLVILVAPSHRYIFKYLKDVVIVNTLDEAMEIIGDYEEYLRPMNMPIRGRIFTEEEFNEMVEEQEKYVEEYAKKYGC